MKLLFPILIYFSLWLKLEAADQMNPDENLENINQSHSIKKTHCWAYARQTVEYSGALAAGGAAAFYSDPILFSLGYHLSHVYFMHYAPLPSDYRASFLVKFTQPFYIYLYKILVVESMSENFGIKCANNAYLKGFVGMLVSVFLNTTVSKSLDLCEFIFKQTFGYMLTSGSRV